MKAKSPSVLRCIEEATQCGQRAAVAMTEADMLRELEMAVAWLELAKSQASGEDGGQDPTNGSTPREH